MKAKDYEQTFKKEIFLTPYQLLQKTEGKKTYPKSCYTPRHTLHKTRKRYYEKRKLHTNIPYEHRQEILCQNVINTESSNP